MRRSPRPILFALLLGSSLFLIGGCSSQPPSQEPVRLVDLFAEATTSGTTAPADAAYAPTEWTFDELEGWKGLLGIADLTVDNGRLTGRTTKVGPPPGAPARQGPPPAAGGASTGIGMRPILSVRRQGDVPADEPLHAIEVTARISAGTELAVLFARGEQFALPPLLFNPFGSMTTPLQPGDDAQTYIIQPPVTITAEAIDHVLISPTNEPGAEFDIDSVRLIFRSEHLASVPSGVGWHGMSEIYRESVVTRAPESVRFTAQLPAEPAFEVALATNEASPVTFRVEIGVGDQSKTLEQEISEPNQWHEQWLDLDGLGGREVEIALSLEAERAGALGFWGAPAIRSAASGESDPDLAPQAVILIIADTLRSDHLASYGYERATAPTVSRMAGEGVLFTDAISQATWTKLSVPAIQTSLYPTTHTIEQIPDRLPASATTIAEVYRAAGYTTHALTTIPFVGRLTNLHQGYEIFHEATSLERDLGVKSARELVGRLLPWIEQHRDTRFFALLHVADPHSPYRPLKEDETHFSEAGAMDRLDEMLEQIRPNIKHNPLMRQFGMPRREEIVASDVDPDDFVRHELEGYDNSIKGMDIALERLFSRLQELGLAEKTLVALVSDHGTEFLEHDAHFHGHTVYGELNRVPMMLWGPGRVPSGQKVDVTVQTIDLMPTLLELSGLEVPEAAQGQSLRPLFESAEQARWNRPAITEAPWNFRGPAMTALVYDGWKLIRSVSDGAEPRFELFDHEQDPLNLTDVSADHQDVVDRLAKQLDNWRGFAESARLDDSAALEGMDAEQLERLRSLGYVQ